MSSNSNKHFPSPLSNFHQISSKWNLIFWTSIICASFSCLTQNLFQQTIQAYFRLLLLLKGD
jgi:hypothetical protein